jgi:NADH-quinone oxidoreductase subunit J
VAVLFLFVVMMLDVDFAELRAGFIRNAPLGAIVGIILLGELIVVLGGYTFTPELAKSIARPIPSLAQRSNTGALGDILYTDYLFYFEVAGLLLLVAMVGAIVLTLRHKQAVKRQSIVAQVARNPKTAVKLHDVKTGEGVS